MVKYQLPEQVQIFQRGDKYVFINPLLPAWVVTNELGQLIISQFDGNNTIDDIVDAAGCVVMPGVIDTCRCQVVATCAVSTAMPLNASRAHMHRSR